MAADTKSGRSVRVALVLIMAALLVIGIVGRFREEPAGGDLCALAAEIFPSVVLVWYHGASDVANCGTAFSVDGEGHFLTCAHVVYGEENVTIAIPTPTGEKNVPARVISEDPDIDAALLYAEGTDIPPVRFGRSDRVRAGEKVAFVGFPLGYTVNADLTPSLTVGYVAAIPEWRVHANAPRLPMIQVDAAIAVGNSGSPLFLEESGLVVGMMKSQIRVPGLSRAREDVLGWAQMVPDELVPHAGIGLALPMDKLREFLKRNGIE